MKLLIIRHGDPDYEHDSLTPKGFREADLLAEKLIKTPIDYYYVSSMGRAQDTAAPTLAGKRRTAVICDWLREFSARLIWRPDVTTRRKIPWDWLPADWTSEDLFLQEETWMTQDIMAEAGIGTEYRYVIDSFDTLLARHGYVRENRYYRAVRPNEDVIALFCHFGLECVLLSHLWNVSPMPLWHGLCCAPTSVTTVVTEERREGIASFRASSVGDISHLYAAGESPSPAASFCECYRNTHQRHD